jgi:hypothetical protein
MKRNTKEENRDHKSGPRYTEKDIQMLYTIKQVLRLVYGGASKRT